MSSFIPAGRIACTSVTRWHIISRSVRSRTLLPRHPPFSRLTPFKIGSCSVNIYPPQKCISILKPSRACFNYQTKLIGCETDSYCQWPNDGWRQKVRQANRRPSDQLHAGPMIIDSLSLCWKKLPCSILCGFAVDVFLWEKMGLIEFQVSNAMNMDLQAKYEDPSLWLQRKTARTNCHNELLQIWRS